MFTTEFWRDTLERAISTFAQTIIALVGVNISDAVSLDWVAILVAGLIAAGISVLKGLAAGQLGDHTNPSLAQKYEYPTETPVESLTP
jgi:hypothetical protein